MGGGGNGPLNKSDLLFPFHRINSIIDIEGMVVSCPEFAGDLQSNEPPSRPLQSCDVDKECI